MNEFRRDPITGRLVIISAHRDARPNQYQSDEDATGVDDSAATCPFCANQMDTPPIISAYGHRESEWQVCVVPNLYPVLNTPNTTSPELPPFPGVLRGIPAEGYHEVVIESPTHVTRSGELGLTHIAYMLRAYRDRMISMSRMGTIVYTQVLKNWGQEAGASLRHCHSQIFGLPFVPEQVEQEIDGAHRYFEHHGHCVYCSLIQQEIRIAGDGESSSRVIAETDDFVVWCPHASRFGYETWIAPRSHSASFEESSDALMDRLATVLQMVLRQLEHHPRIGAFNYLVHSLPFDSNRHDQYHWHIEIIPRIAKEAGFEWGTGVHVNTITPERAARELRVDHL